MILKNEQSGKNNKISAERKGKKMMHNDYYTGSPQPWATFSPHPSR